MAAKGFSPNKLLRSTQMTKPRIQEKVKYSDGTDQSSFFQV